MGLQEVGLIVAGVLVLMAVIWVANRFSNKGSASPKQ